jgi:hypothetical protein
MPLPLVRTDFNSNSLGSRWTAEDLERQGLRLREGMRCVFYDLDCQDGRSGYLHGEGTVWWDAKLSQFRIDLRTLRLGFTPGEDPAALAAAYAE